MKATHLTKADFLTKVANYETNPNEWKLDELAGEYEGKVDIYKIDVDAEEELAALFGIRSVPSLLFIPMTGSPQMAQGAMPKHALKDAIQKVLLNA